MLLYSSFIWWKNNLIYLVRKIHLTPETEGSNVSSVVPAPELSLLRNPNRTMNIFSKTITTWIDAHLTRVVVLCLHSGQNKMVATPPVQLVRPTPGTREPTEQRCGTSSACSMLMICLENHKPRREGGRKEGGKEVRRLG